jgi:hypothetical protein
MGGRAVDRHGVPLPNVEVFRSGDRPDWIVATTDAMDPMGKSYRRVTIGRGDGLEACAKCAAAK